jgi:hypothetical protein
MEAGLHAEPARPEPCGGLRPTIARGAAVNSPLLARQPETESLDVPAIWSDGSRGLYQCSELGATPPVPGQAAPVPRSRVEQVGPDG